MAVVGAALVSLRLGALFLAAALASVFYSARLPQVPQMMAMMGSQLCWTLDAWFSW